MNHRVAPAVGTNRTSPVNGYWKCNINVILYNNTPTQYLQVHSCYVLFVSVEMIVVEIYLTTVKPLLSEHEETSLFIDLGSHKN
jgi:hypothetical protein